MVIGPLHVPLRNELSGVVGEGPVVVVPSPQVSTEA
jgi:hypothetical protein